MATMHRKIFCVREFIKTELATAVQHVFHLRFIIQPPIEQVGCMCKGKSSSRPRVSEENMRRIQESFECSPRKSTAVEQAENLEY